MPERVNSGHWAEDFEGDYNPGSVQMGGCLVIVAGALLGLIGLAAIVGGVSLML